MVSEKEVMMASVLNRMGRALSLSGVALLSLLPGLSLLSCSSQQSAEQLQRHYQSEGDRLDEEAKGKRVAYTFERFINSPGYRTSRDVWRGAALQLYDPQHSRVEILLDVQRGRLYIQDQIAMDFPVCSGRVGGHETPRGSFRITQKIRDHRSNLYGSLVDAKTGKVVRWNAEAGDARPAGTLFRGASMPFWMRFNGSIGMHVGQVHRESKSHGCVRIPVEACETLYDKLAVGSRVIVR